MSAVKCSFFVPAALAPLLAGCLFVPKTSYNEIHSENRVLAEQNRAQETEIGNLRDHARVLEDRLMQTEQQLAIYSEQNGRDRRQLARYEEEHDALYRQYQALARSAYLPPSTGEQLLALSRRYPSLQFDPATGLSKLDTDVLFDSGEAELKPGAREMLADLARVLNAPEAKNLKVMVVGHTDAQAIGKKPVREKFADNFQLSTARALTVAQILHRCGLPERQIGVAGFGSCQPVAPNDTAQNRHKNRRVEIFVMSPEVPVIGWTDSIPGVYRR
ncbi:MAG: OmpA family protein [Pirellulales bacterium]|nr:OmpA family protein [Pirellulales bacterium]